MNMFDFRSSWVFHSEEVLVIKGRLKLFIWVTNPIKSSTGAWFRTIVSLILSWFITELTINLRQRDLTTSDNVRFNNIQLLWFCHNSCISWSVISTSRNLDSSDSESGSHCSGAILELRNIVSNHVPRCWRFCVGSVCWGASGMTNEELVRGCWNQLSNQVPRSCFGFAKIGRFLFKLRAALGAGAPWASHT